MDLGAFSKPWCQIEAAAAQAMGKRQVSLRREGTGKTDTLAAAVK